MNYREVCGKCGARRVDAQLGLEKTPLEYVSRMVEVFREVRRVLRSDGTCWVNMGDSYYCGKGQSAQAWSMETERNTLQGAHTYTGGRGKTRPNDLPQPGLKPKDLVGIPWRVAFALQADGWYLRSDIIWAKPNPMPESVRDRPTRSHEYIFLMSKESRYYYDAEAIKEPGSEPTKMPDGWDTAAGTHGTIHRQGREKGRKTDKQRGHSRRHAGFNDRWDAMEKAEQCSFMRNKRSVWTVATRPYAEAHFATFPPDLIEPCIKAGCPPAGKRCDCGEVIETPTGSGPVNDPSILTGRAGMNRPRRPEEGTRPITRREQRWQAEEMKQSPFRDTMREICGEAFDHYIRIDQSGARPLPEPIRAEFTKRGWITEVPACEHPIEPAGVVLDPFFGAGTTGLVAMRLGREFIGIELNPNYCGMARKRIYGELHAATL